MVYPKNPGIGRGKGGGRPRRQDPVEMLNLRLTPQTVETLRAAAETQGVPVWQVVEHLVLQGPPTQDIAGTTAGPELPPVALKIAQDAADFLAQADDPEYAAKTLLEWWRSALAKACEETGILPVAAPVRST
jgi:hypothetical protein